jgi:hypothetical protein
MSQEHSPAYLPILWFQIENEQSIPFITGIVNSSESFGQIEHIFISEMLVFSKKANRMKKIYAANVKLLWNTKVKSIAREKINEDKRFKLPFDTSGGFWDIKKNKSQTLSFDGFPLIKTGLKEEDEEIIRITQENEELRQFVMDTIIHQKNMQLVCKENTLEMNTLRYDFTELKIMAGNLQEENKRLHHLNRDLLSCQIANQTSLQEETIKSSNYEANLLLLNLSNKRTVEFEMEKRVRMEEQLKSDLILRCIEHAEYLAFIHSHCPNPQSKMEMLFDVLA